MGFFSSGYKKARQLGKDFFVASVNTGFIWLKEINPKLSGQAVMSETSQHMLYECILIMQYFMCHMLKQRMVNKKMIDAFIQETIAQIDKFLRKVLHLSDKAVEEHRIFYSLRIKQYEMLHQQTAKPDRSAPLYEGMLSNIIGKNIADPGIIDSFTVHLLVPFVKTIDAKLDDEKIKKIYGLG